MADMTAFERQVGDEIFRIVGPARPVDDLAVYEAVIATDRQKGWNFTMFSALRFVVAGAIVALFGGFLLTSVFTTQQDGEVLPAAATESPTATANVDILPGVTLSVDEVEPGVFRVAGDGVRDLASVGAVDIVAGYDDGIWLLREDGLLRLGSDGSYLWPVGTGPGDHIFEIAPDGTMWVIPDERRGASLRSTDGEAWTVQLCPLQDCAGFTVAPDGTVWASWADEGDRWRVGYLGPTGWQPLDGYALSAWSSDKGSGPQPTSINYDHLFMTDAGDLYGAECWADVERGCYLHRYEDGDWLGEDLYGVGYFNYGKVLDVGSDGTVWLEGSISDSFLSRFADGEWVVYTPADLPAVGLGLDHQFEVAPDGSLWASLWRSANDGDARLGEDPYRWWEEQRVAVEDGRLLCDGLARFDGDTLDRFLPGQCVSMDIAADGSVWVLASGDLYVITPEVIATGG